MEQRLLEASKLNCHGDVGDVLFPISCHELSPGFVVIDSILLCTAGIWQPADEHFHTSLSRDRRQITRRELDISPLQMADVLRITQSLPHLFGLQIGHVDDAWVEP
jgi:hypothetical protein